MADEFVEFFKSAFVEQEFDAFAGGKLAFAVLPLRTLGSAAFFGARVTPPEFF
jgi:hypothetical protein